VGYLVLIRGVWHILFMILSKSFKLLFIFLLTLFFMVGNGASAQDKVEVRADDKDDYTRLVFEWPAKTSYQINNTNDVLTVTFDGMGVADVTGVNNGSFKNIGSIGTEENNGSLVAKINLASNSNVRAFNIGRKIFFDISGGQGEASNAAMPTVSAQANATSSNDTDNNGDVPTPDQSALETTTSNTNDTAIGEREIAGNQPHVIVVSSTESVGMAAFERANHLWLVFDKELKTAPAVSGPNQEQFNNIEKIDLNNGVAYRFAKPFNNYFYGEGGGLLWRFVLTPNPRNAKSMQPVITEDAALSWPLNGVARELEVPDPVVGDVIKVVTVNDASEFSVDRRDYVDFTVLPSYIGLAYVPKSDNVTAQASQSKDAYVINKPGGLAISPVGDTASAILRDDIEREAAVFDAEDNPDNIKRIYDFDRWKMGGINALDKNRQILMNDLVNKSGARKAEDLITLAKLNIANDRGPEALGLLRVAALELPGIDENPEFMSLKGAAASLSARYDVAVENLFLPSLQTYDEINYWKAFALAGLEDWNQADTVMPQDLRPVENYPQQIKEPIALALAETSLRAGKNDRAEELLMMLEPDFSGMSMSRQSAWKYLNGELERQKGNFDQAAANWKPLLDGKDDYYRAKAGLSVTKMELDRNKVTAEKAIDRLEGLRYAWRGDELESLINLRLGEVYVENANYLKGLSVLRNAVSISPNAKITEEITNYMTASFRRLFTDGSLDKISPIEAVSIYEEFKELTPIGKEGDLFVRNLAERLVDVELLGRAIDILQYQVTHRLEGEEKSQVAIRLAAIQLLDGKPDGAIQSLNTASAALKDNGETDIFKEREIKLLRARALSKTGKSQEGLKVLNSMREDNDVLKLKTDIAWSAGEWGMAANALDKLIDSANISLTTPPEEFDVNLIVNRAIALNLAGDRNALDQHRNKYNDLILQSDKARIFDMVTRPRRLGILDNQQSVATLISEVDLFGGFLDNYKSIQE